MIDWTPFTLSFKLAFVTTLILLLIGIPVAWWLANTRSRLKPFIEALVSMPLVLPPTVIGFYVLWLLAPESMIGSLLEKIGIEVVFAFPGLVIGSILYSFPFMVQPLQSGFESVDRSIIEASYVAGKSQLETLLRVVLPAIKPSLLSAIIITFAHTIGEFGVVLMVGGSIPGKTQVASIAIYEYVEALDYEHAHIYSLIMLAISFAVLLSVYWLNRRFKRVAQW